VPKRLAEANKWLRLKRRILWQVGCPKVDLGWIEGAGVK
jgi:hypothetical protein